MGPYKALLSEAITELNLNHVIGFPTETVYGLAAKIDSPEALNLIFKIKQRPFFDPLIVHVHSAEQAKKYVVDWPKEAAALTDAFWPGPLTLVIEKNSLIDDLITSGLPRVGLRCPAHPLALELLQTIGVPLAAPSANLFGRVSPTTAEHVMSEFPNESLAVLDGGPCEVGIESTVVLLKKKLPSSWEFSILRPGLISAADLLKAFAEKGLVVSQVHSSNSKEAPGQMQHHYMPAKPLILCTKANISDAELVNFFLSQVAHLPSEVAGVPIYRPQAKTDLQITELKLPMDSRLAARSLYGELRKAAEKNGDILIFRHVLMAQDPLWAALEERLLKAASLVYQ